MAAGMNGQKLTDDICRSVLKNSQKKIVEEMDPERVLVKLRQIEFLSHDDYTAIRGVPDRSKQNLSLLSTIRKSGKQAYCDFKKILKETGQEGIILELESKEKKELGIETAGHYVERKIDQDLARHKRMETNKKPAENPLESLDRSVTVVTVETIQKDLHDGRLITLDNKMIEELKMISWTNDQLKGGFGTVYISNKRVAGFKIRVVLKEIVLKAGNSSQNRKEKSITNEKIASRLMHFGIVPLLAYHDDDINRTYYFVSPYLENGDLYEAIAADRDCREKDIRLRWKTRIKIMYQIACAINFMHTGNEFRRTVLHMDIKSKNIVLDTNFNARLIDFGLAREFIDDDATSIVTPAIAGNLGYSPNAHKLTKNDDYYCFGGVLIELITGLNASASEEGIPLHQWHRELIVQRQQVSVWNETSRTIVDKVVAIKENLFASGKSEQIMNDLEGICRNQSVPKWETIEEDIRCEICLVNEKMEVRFEGHDDDSPIQRACTKQIRICCSCMRNSYINPVKCHTCGETIQPFINANWGAILVAGYDRKAGKVLQNDIKKFKEVITSKVLPAMCINPDNVIILAEDMHGITADKLDGAFDDLSKKDIRTLLFVYSGHHGDYGFQLGPNVYYDLNKVSERINKWNEGKPKFGKVIAFLDCCVPDKLNLNKILKLIQFNATSPTTTADLDTTKGSPFLMYVMQAFTARANGDICIHKGCKCSKHIRGDFITINDLWEYLNEHTKNGNLKPFINITNIDMKGTILAYNYDFEVKFEFTLQWLDMETWKLYVLPKDFNDLKQLKLILAQEFLKHVYDINPEGSAARSKFAKIISLEIQTGPNTTIEIDSVELLVLYWTSKRQLRCVARRLQNVNVDIPVGRCFKNVPDILVVHQKILQQCEITEQQLTTSNLRKYRQELENNTGYDDYRKALEIIICHAHTQLLHNRLEISFFDLRKGLTMVYMNLKKTADIQENME